MKFWGSAFTIALFLANNALALTPRVYNGTRVLNTGTPYVQVRESNPDGSSALCSGSLLSRTAVLTASHCVTKDSRMMSVIANGKKYRVKRVRIHPDARTDHRTGIIYNDVAILHLEKAVTASILPLLVSAPARPGDSVTIVGYGRDASGNAGILQQATTFIDNVDSYFILSNFTNPTQGDSCSGDSGGPMILSYLTKEGLIRYGIIGVVSVGTDADCSPSSSDQSLYINVQGRAKSFIRREVPNVRLR